MKLLEEADFSGDQGSIFSPSTSQGGGNKNFYPYTHMQLGVILLF